MTSCRVIVLEKTGRWAAAVRALRYEGMPAIVEVRTLAELRGRLTESPSSLLLLETTPANLAAVSALIGELCARHKKVAVAALVDAEASSAESLLREAGAHDVVSSVLEVPRLARMACRLATQSPPHETSLPEFIDQVLPWPSFATRQWIEGTV